MGKMFFFMQNIFNSPAMQHGCRAKHLFVLGIYFVFAFDLYYQLKNLNHSSGKKEDKISR